MKQFISKNGRAGNWINRSLLKLAMTSKTHMKGRIRSDNDDHDRDRDRRIERCVSGRIRDLPSHNATQYV
jgi:hypothetical protein